MGDTVFNLRDNLCGWGFHGKQMGGMAVMDIVERLRTFDSVPDADVIILMNEAADEIERLRKALKKIADATHSDWFSMKETARAALKGDE